VDYCGYTHPNTSSSKRNLSNSGKWCKQRSKHKRQEQILLLKLSVIQMIQIL
jgi:hypothetical protein